jgi:hypothetical protein
MKKIKNKEIKLDKLTKKDYEFLYSYAMSEIGEWSKFIILLSENYEPNTTKKVRKTIPKSGEGLGRIVKGKRLGKKA